MARRPSTRRPRTSTPSAARPTTTSAVLYKDFRASKQDDLKASLGTYGQAKSFFQDFLGKTGDEDDKTEAKAQIASDRQDDDPDPELHQGPGQPAAGSRGARGPRGWHASRGRREVSC